MSLGPHTLLAKTVIREAEKLGRQIDYIEIGVCLGNSAKAVLDTGTVRRYTGVDNWQDSFDRNDNDKHYGPKEIKAKLNGHNVELITGDSKVQMPLISGRKEQYDVGFVDGDHSDSGCLADMSNMLPLIRKGGVMLVDDIRHPGHTLEPIVRNFADSNSLGFAYHEDHEGVAELSI